MRNVELALGERSYSILIGSGVRRQWELLAPFVKKKAVLVTNTTVAPLYLHDLCRLIESHGVEVIQVILPDGEEHKNWTTLNLVFDALLGAHCERSTPIIALGGGVIGDLTGFAAACYQRGAPFIQMPTTLLSQVDSSVGGKTAINHPLGKNMIGAFHQPRRVLIDIDTLQTLPDRELSAGLAEIIKVALVRDEPLFIWLEANIDLVRRKDYGALEEVITRSCQNKADIVIADETEQGERALLNLGHTFGHAIETGMGYGTWLHGEAVAAGTMMAAELSAELGWLERTAVQRIEALFRRSGLPTMGPAGLLPTRYIELMSHDKKVINGQLRLVLLKAIGRGIVADQVSADLIQKVIKRRISP